MGYYADSTIDLFIDKGKAQGLRDALMAEMRGGGGDISTAEMIGSLLGELATGEDGALTVEMNFYGSTTGKMFTAVDEVYDLLAGYGVTGTIDWVEDVNPDSRWRVRFLDGDWNQYDGYVTVMYHDDPVDVL